jgi:Omp85 superfamily domain
MIAIAHVLAVAAALAGAVPEDSSPSPGAAPVAEERPPPDPAAGERPDGRLDRSPIRWGHISAEIALFPFRALFLLLRYPVGFTLRFEDRHHLIARGSARLSGSNGQRDVSPVFYYSTIFIPEVGLRYIDLRTLGRDTRLAATVTVGGANYVFTELSMEPTPAGEPVGLTVDVVFDRRADLIYNGLGNHTYSDAPTGRFLANALEARLGLRARLLPWLGLYLTYGAGLKRFANGDRVGGDPGVDYVYNPASITGFVQGTTFFRASAGLVLSALDNERRPSRGLWANVAADYTYGIDGDPSSYERLRAHAGVPINLWAHTHVLWLLAATALTWSNAGPVVFSELPTLGGPDDLRGFRLHDFRDYTSLYATLEYRWPLSPWIDASLFTDYGGVFGAGYAGFGARRMQPDVGFGLRVASTGNYVIRAQLGYGFGEGVNFSLSASSGR